MKVIDNKRVQIFDKLAASGADTEKKITALDAADMVDICLKQGMQIVEMKQIIELQNAIKQRRLVRYFTGGIDLEEKEEADDEHTEIATGDGTAGENDTDPENRVQGNGSRIDLRAEGVY